VSISLGSLFTVGGQFGEEVENIAALRKTGGNKAKAARRLNIDSSTLYRKLRELHIDEEQFSC
jgi:DNA-binding NtrC family response regulator